MWTSPSPRPFLLTSWLLLLVVMVEVVEVRGGKVKRWATSYDQPFSYQCPNGQALSFIHSIHNNHHEDRIWNFACQTVPGSGDCSISAPANGWDGVMNFQCPRDEVIGGMAGVHNNRKEDRIYSFVCCKTTVHLSGCIWTADLNNFDGPVYYRLHHGQVFQGFYSRHNNHHEDRIWRAKICNTTPSG